MAKKELIEDLPSNSKSSRVAPIRSQSKKMVEEELEIEATRKPRPTRVRAVRKKRSFTQSIAQAFVGEDTKNVGSYILNDVLIPAAKNLIQEMVTSGIEMFLFGETGGRKSRDRDRGRSVINYSSFSRRDREERRRPVAKDRFDLNSIFFKDHTDAEEVLDELCDRLEEYEQVSVADYFDIAGIDGATWAHDKYGWENLKKAFCTHTRQGWAIVLPDPVELD